MKIMVVEDDTALREIYSIRIVAEGYEVVSAGDGEEALAVAVRERPDLILADVMMPKISGFDMLDILRNTPETANIHVIMMTALSSDADRERGERLGCNRYLVKSQVGIEDVINAIHEVLGDRTNSPASPAIQSTPSQPTSAQPQVQQSQPVQPQFQQPQPMPSQTPQPQFPQSQPIQPTPAQPAQATFTPGTTYGNHQA